MSSIATGSHAYESIPDKEEEEVIKYIHSIDKDDHNPTTNTFSWANFGIMMSYFCVGVVARITQAPLQYYLIHALGMSSTTYSANVAINKLPWIFKIVYGIVTDAYPLFGWRRKSWMFLGWTTVVFLSFCIAVIGLPSLYPMVFLTFGITLFEVMADVATDSLAVDLSYFEAAEQRGGLQATGYIFRSTGKIVGAIIGTYLYNNHYGAVITSTDDNLNLDVAPRHTFPTFAKIGDMFFLQGLIILICLYGFLYPLKEFASRRPGQAIPSIRNLIWDLWQVLQKRAIWRPMIFLYIFNVMQIPNSSWSNFIVVGLNFTSRDLGYLSLGSSFISLLGYSYFRTFLFDTSWRTIYLTTSIIALIFTLLEVLLVLRINVQLGISDVWFAVGEDLVLTFVEIVHVMPYIILFVMICPEGAEGTTFALLTTTSAVSGAVSSAIGSYLSLIWDVSNDALKRGDFSGVLKLTILTGLLNFVPLALVSLLPNGRKEHQEEIDKGITSFWGGFVLVFVIGMSIIFTVVSSFWLLL